MNPFRFLGLPLKRGMTTCAIAMALSALQSCGQNTPIVETTICEVIDRPSMFDHKRIQVHAQIESDGMHAMGAFDSQCPHFGILIQYSSRVSQHRDIKELEDAVYPEGTLHVKVTTSLVGLFYFRPAAPLSRVLQLESVSHLVVKKVK